MWISGEASIRARRFDKARKKVAGGLLTLFATPAYHRLRRTPIVGRLLIGVIDLAVRGKPSVATRVIRGPLAGMVIELDPRVEADSIVGAYESRIQEAMCSELREGDKVFDVGAHFGYVALVIGTCVGSSGEVICFEPDPVAYSTLCTNVELNGASINARITKVRAAVGASAGRATFARGVHSTRGKLSEAGDVEVDVITLDDALQRFGVPRLVKVDVEGSELDVLKGGAQMLEARATVFVVETHSPSLSDACRHVFESYGYESEQLHERGRAETHLVAKPRGPG